MKFKRITVIITFLFFLFSAIGFPTSGYGITIKEEEELGAEFMKVTRSRYRFIRDPFIVDYINKVGNIILSTMPPQPFQYRFYVIRQDVFNAFAGPGGNIFVNSGLIEAMESEAELAGILSHEITHVKARHISRRIERSSKIQLATLAGMVAGIFLGIGGAGAAANAVSIGSMAAGQSASLAYSRQDEMQADELGIGYLTAAGYGGKGLLVVLKRIRDAQIFGSSEIPSYLMTHPAVDDRIAYIDTWIEANPKISVFSRKNNDDQFRAVRTRLTAAYGDKEKALTIMKDAERKKPEDPVINQGYGIALARNNNPEKGIVYLEKALGKKPFDAVLLKDMGEICFMDGQYERGLRSLKGSISIDPNDFETLFLLGRTYIELEEYEKASSALRKLLEKRPNYQSAYYYLGNALGKQGQMGDAHYYLGIFYQNKRDFKNAVFHLKRTLKYSIDPVRRSEVEKMLARAKKKKSAQRDEAIKKPRPVP